MKRTGLVVACVISLGCGRASGPAAQGPAVAPRNADTDTCAACGMVVRDQPAPRGQIIRRDGTHEFLCSVGDLLQYVRVPSPLGKPAAIYVEEMDVNHRLGDLSAQWRPWRPAGSLFYVVGIERSGVMGMPVMAYGSRDLADTAVQQVGGHVATFKEIGQWEIR